jgi:tetratricopeptide (TPR) repeat protein
MLRFLRAPDKAARDSLLVVYESQHPGLGRQAVWRSLMWQDSMAVSRYLADSLVPDTDVAPMAWIELAAGRGSALGALAGDFDPHRCRRESADFDRAQCSRYLGITLERASLNMPGGLRESAAVVQDLYSAIRDHFSDSRRGWIGQMVRYWYLGMLSVRLDDIESASAWADSMSRLAADSVSEDATPSEVRFGTELPGEVRAAIAVERGERDAALTILEGVTPSNDSPEAGAYVTRRRPYTRLTKGSLLLEKGRYAEADGWFATFPDFEPPNEELAFLAPALRGRAVANDSLRRYPEALHHYRRFVTRWQDADPHLQPQVEEARQRIRELERELN